MNIANTLVNLRDDLKEWIVNNIEFVKTLIPTDISQLNNDKGYITDINLGLKIHTDGLLYVFKNGVPVGMGINLGDYEGGGEGDTLVNLLDTCEYALNKRFSQSGGGLVAKAGMMAIYVPIKPNTDYKLSFYNLNEKLTSTGDNNMYALKSDKTYYGIFNGANSFKDMTTGVTISGNEGKNATVEFTTTNTPTYIVVNLLVSSATITDADIANYIITLE